MAARAMRQIVVDRARHGSRKKRGGGEKVLTLLESDAIVEVDLDEVLAVDEALTELSRFDENLARVVELRVLGGLGSEEAAVVLGVTDRTVRSRWRSARAWLGCFPEERSSETE